jgi:hypothetical protein
LSLTSRVKMTAESADEDLQDAIAPKGFPAEEHIDVVNASKTLEDAKANASSHRSTRSAEVVCSNLLQMTDLIFAANEISSVLVRKDEKLAVSEGRIEGSKVAANVCSR